MAFTWNPRSSISFFAQGMDAAVLITDATSATGMPDERYHLGHFEVEVKNGRCSTENSQAACSRSIEPFAT